MAAYNALFDSMKSTQNSGLKKSNIPTLVLIDPKDELVNIEGLHDLIERNSLHEWRMQQLSNKGNTLERGAYHHLIIDEPSLGPNEWKKVREAIREHLGGNSSMYWQTTLRISAFINRETPLTPRPWART